MKRWLILVAVLVAFCALAVVSKAFMAIFCIVIIMSWHELAHAMVGLWRGIPFKRLQLGFGRPLFEWHLRGITIAICPVLLGAAVVYDDEQEERLNEVRNVVPIALAGPLSNYLMATLLTVVMLSAVGVQMASDQPVIGDVSVGGAAHGVLQVGDVITEVNGKSVQTWHDLAQLVLKERSQGREVDITVQRSGQLLAFKFDPPASRFKPFLGILPSGEFRRLPIGESLLHAGVDIVNYTAIPYMLIASAEGRQLASSGLAGPVGIVKDFADEPVSKTDTPVTIALGFLIRVSLALGAFNLLPLFPLDGGRIIIALFASRFKPKHRQAVWNVSGVLGIAAIAFVFVLAMRNDVLRLFQY